MSGCDHEWLNMMVTIDSLLFTGDGVGICFCLARFGQEEDLYLSEPLWVAPVHIGVCCIKLFDIYINIYAIAAGGQVSL